MSSSLAAITFATRVGCFLDLCRDFRVRKALEEWAREKRRKKDARLPVSSIMLQQLIVLPTVCSSQYKVLLFQSAFWLASLGAFRVGELVVGSQHDYSGHPLAMQDINWVDGGLVTTIRWSKTDRLGLALPLVPPPPPSRLVFRKSLADSARGVQVLFVHGNGFPRARYPFSILFRRTVTAIGAPPEQFTVHSFHIGATSLAVAAGLSANTICNVGHGWSTVF